MNLRRIFRAQNLYLLFALGINISLLFAPLAYAANYDKSIFAWLYGSRIVIEDANPWAGTANFEHVSWNEDALLGTFSALLLLMALILAFTILFNADDQKKFRLMLYSLAGLGIQIVLAIALRSGLESYVGQASPADIESHLEAQFYLLFFPIIFCLWAMSRNRKFRDKTEE